MPAFSPFSRRHFIYFTGATLIGATPPVFSQSAPAKFRAAVIVHTGRGDYGHGMDLIFQNRENVRLVAVADADEAGRAKAAAKLTAPKAYADYRDMLAKESPQLVSIALRHSDQHAAMAMAALQAGAHFILEKPFTVTLAEADEILALADKQSLKVAVAHQMRMDPAVRALEKAVADGSAIGDLVEMHAWGKQDARAGGEDLAVLGIHLFDFMRLFAGEAQWGQASVTQDGRPITLADVRVPKDNVGPVAGDAVKALFGFAKGVTGSFTSHGKLREHTGAWGLELVGTKGAVRINANLPPRIYESQLSPWTEEGRATRWTLWKGFPQEQLLPAKGATQALNALMTDDWLAAIQQNRPPRCSGLNAMRAQEMAAAVWQSALAGARVALPLAKRSHPLAKD